jgi:hypothetical protein
VASDSSFANFIHISNNKFVSTTVTIETNRQAQQGGQKKKQRTHPPSQTRAAMQIPCTATPVYLFSVAAARLAASTADGFGLVNSYLASSCR